MHFNAEFYVAAGFVLFLMLAGYFGVHRMIPEALDKRGKLIADELAEARRLREEAETLLASFKQKAAGAEKEAQSIVAQAQEEAQAMAKEATARMEEFVTRRTKQAETKIAMAEAQATSEVRAAAADAAANAAEAVMRTQTTGDAAAALVTKGIGELKMQLH